MDALKKATDKNLIVINEGMQFSAHILMEQLTMQFLESSLL